MAQQTDDKPQDFYAAIGRALTVWSSVENDLCTLFCRCVGPMNGFPSNRAFWSITSFEAKVRTVNAVVMATFGEKDSVSKAWIDCRDELGRINRWRNKIAHGTLVTMPYIDKSTKKEVTDVFFAPYFWGTLGQKSGQSALDLRPTDRMYRKDIEEACRNFSAMEDRLRELASKVFEALYQDKLKGERRRDDPAIYHEGQDTPIEPNE